MGHAWCVAVVGKGPGFCINYPSPVFSFFVATVLAGSSFLGWLSLNPYYLEDQQRFSRSRNHEKRVEFSQDLKPYGKRVCRVVTCGFLYI
jgi:hypothetical protein